MTKKYEYHGERYSNNGQATKEYQCWCAIKSRCQPFYRRHNIYYDKGIKVCDRWKGDEGYANFLEDMGRAPSPDHSIDRIDNDGNYSPDNCRWATLKEQGRNTSQNVLINGKTLGQWADETGLSYQVLSSRKYREGITERWLRPKDGQRDAITGRWI